MIPKVFHCIWTQGPPPDDYWKWIDSWERVNPGWKHLLWSEKSYRHLLGDLTEVHDSTPYGTSGAHYAQMADIAAKAILWEVGGVMMCADFEALRPMDQIFAGKDHPVCWWESPGQLSNGIIGVPQKHPASKAVIEALPDSVRQQRERAQQINYGAGPMFIHRIWADRQDVEKRPSEEVYPYLWTDPVPESYGDAYAVHHWKATWK